MENKLREDIAKNSFIGNWPIVLRWFLFIPTAIFGSVVVSSLYLFLIWIGKFTFGGPNTGGFFFQLISSAILGYVFVYAGAWMAPRYQFGISIFLLILLSMIAVILFLFSFLPLSSVSPLELLVHIVAILIAGGYVVYNIRSNQ